MRSPTYRAVLFSFAIIVAIFIIWICICEPILNVRARRRAFGKVPLLQRTMDAVDRAMDHLFTVKKDIDLDILFGVRLVQDQLSALLHGILLNGGLAKQNGGLTPILFRISILQEQAFQFRLQFEPEESEGLRMFLIAGTWDLLFSSRSVDRLLMPSYKYNKMLEESLELNSSAYCMAAPYIKKCHISEYCWRKMVSPDLKGFSLNHKVIYLLHGVSLGCGQEVEFAVQANKQMSLDQLLARECASVLHEVELIAGKNFPLQHRDLFLKHVTFCGILGYQDFFKDDWLEKIFSWQNVKGCFPVNRTAFEIQQKAELPPVSTVRVKRETTPPIADDCSSHLTAAAIGALVQNIRFLVEPLLEK